jgi:regulatory protein YycH of two-component signal transduction system YycFG
MKKTIIATAIITALVIITAYFSYTVYTLRQVVASHDIVLNQIVNLINSSPKK